MTEAPPVIDKYFAQEIARILEGLEEIDNNDNHMIALGTRIPVVWTGEPDAVAGYCEVHDDFWVFVPVRGEEE